MKKVHRRRVVWKRMVEDYHSSKFKVDGLAKQWNPETLLAF
jgi:hypothetical protein